MEKTIIVLAPHADDYLTELVTTLYREEYFGFEEDAHEYAEKIRSSIYADIPSIITHHKTPEGLKKYGTYYIKIKVNRRTTWYVFFEKNNNRYFVEFITNNHSPEAGYFNGL